MTALEVVISPTFGAFSDNSVQMTYPVQYHKEWTVSSSTIFECIQSSKFGAEKKRLIQMYQNRSPHL